MNYWRAYILLSLVMILSFRCQKNELLDLEQHHPNINHSAIASHFGYVTMNHIRYDVHHIFYQSSGDTLNSYLIYFDRGKRIGQDTIFDYISIAVAGVDSFYTQKQIRVMAYSKNQLLGRGNSEMEWSLYYPIQTSLPIINADVSRKKLSLVSLDGVALYNKFIRDTLHLQHIKVHHFVELSPN